jgi:hypothetical protein
MAEIPIQPNDGPGTGRFGILMGKRRWVLEVGGRCACGCQRPGDAHWAEAHDVYQEEADHRRAQYDAWGWVQCECTDCGEWFSGPLQPGQVRRFFGCVNLVLRNADPGPRCRHCPHQEWTGGKRPKHGGG